MIRNYRVTIPALTLTDGRATSVRSTTLIPARTYEVSVESEHSSPWWEAFLKYAAEFRPFLLAYEYGPVVATCHARDNNTAEEV